MIVAALTLLASAAEPVETPHWVGLPLARLDTVGLLAPTTTTVAPDVLRYGLPGGGLAMLAVVADAVAADRVFDGMQATMATHWPEGDVRLGDKAVGDGHAIVLVRSRNAVVFVRDVNNDAGAVAARALAALTADPSACAHGGCRPVR